MPWKKVSIMDQRREFVELAMQEGANVRELCRRFGIHPDTGYKWLGRWTSGEELADRSRRPHSSPERTEASIEERVLAVREWRAAAVVVMAVVSLAGVGAVQLVPFFELTRHAASTRSVRVHTGSLTQRATVAPGGRRLVVTPLGQHRSTVSVEVSGGGLRLRTPRVVAGAAGDN